MRCSQIATFITLDLGLLPEDVKAMVLGSHGDLMVPLPKYANVNGIPIKENIVYLMLSLVFPVAWDVVALKKLSKLVLVKQKKRLYSHQRSQFVAI